MPSGYSASVKGVIGAVLAALVMDWAIIVMSSLVGSGLIVVSLGLQSLQGVMLATALAAVGIIVQATITRGKREVPAQNRSQ